MCYWLPIRRFGIAESTQGTFFTLNLCWCPAVCTGIALKYADELAGRVDEKSPSCAKFLGCEFSHLDQPQAIHLWSLPGALGKKNYVKQLIFLNQYELVTALCW